MIKNKILIAVAILLAASTASASAGFFDWIKLQQVQPAQDKFSAFYNQTVSPLNTAQNIKLVSEYMSKQRIKTIKIHVIDYNKDFYIINYAGTTLNSPAYIDRTITLTAQQIKEIGGMLQDGKIDQIEQIRLFVFFKI